MLYLNLIYLSELGIIRLILQMRKQSNPSLHPSPQQKKKKKKNYQPMKLQVLSDFACFRVYDL